jgi:heptaprenylglyceryl phosphate synthase
VRALKEMLDAVSQPAVVEELDWFFKASVRNAFAHADYTLHADSFRTRSEWFELGGVQASEIPLTVLADLLNRALVFYGEFMGEYAEQRRNYQANKIVAGRIVEGSDPVPVELLADADRGLYGIRSPPGES